MNIPVKKWLAPFTWAAVTSNNEAICRAKSALHKATSEGHQPARRLWENSARQNLSLKAALDVCRECHRLAPFCFYNGNTFAGIARAMIHELLVQLDAATAFAFRSAVGHYVAGTIGSEEIELVIQTIEGA